MIIFYYSSNTINDNSYITIIAIIAYIYIYTYIGNNNMTTITTNNNDNDDNHYCRRGQPGEGRGGQTIYTMIINL